jgi:hypothetical protein
MAQAVLAGYGERQPDPGDALACARRIMEAKLAPAAAPDELRALAESSPDPLHREWARRMLETTPPGAVPFELQAVRFSEKLTALFWPGEIVAEYALWIKRLGRPQARRFLAIAYANGAVGYVPSRTIYPEGGYEVNGSHPYYNLPAPYSPDIEDQLRAATRELLESMS